MGIVEILESLKVVGGIKKVLVKNEEAILLISKDGWFNDNTLEFKWNSRIRYPKGVDEAKNWGFKLSQEEENTLNNSPYTIWVYKL